jgi:hypothetical protein
LALDFGFFFPRDPRSHTHFVCGGSAVATKEAQRFSTIFNAYARGARQPLLKLRRWGLARAFRHASTVSPSRNAQLAQLDKIAPQPLSFVGTLRLHPR